ncbi:MAG: MraY family glycosyltransferase [Nitriliruptorales bacterium]|nr:MraY family glycosyltransferase [Nitriliruptorales bacterium]
MLPYGLAFLTAAVGTAVSVPLVARFARRIGAIDPPADPRKVHTAPVPTLGGLAMLVGFLAAFAVASQLPALQPMFATSEPLGMIAGAVVIALVGVADDLRGLSPPVKLAGQIMGALMPILFGIQIVYAWIPGLEVVAVGPDLGLVLTVVAMVVMINAVNLIDGLDGLAAGVVAIAALAFFWFVTISGSQGLAESVATTAPLVAAVLAGMCVGFLVHNFHPASIFMGDTGSMLLGLLVASAGVAYVGRSTAPSYTDFAGSVPLLIPAIVLAIPIADTLFALVRRAYRRVPITVADKGHLHHLLITFGHSHRRAVLILYYWSAVLAGAGVGLSLVARDTLVTALSVAVLVGLLLTALGVRAPEVGDEDDADTSVRRVG